MPDRRESALKSLANATALALTQDGDAFRLLHRLGLVTAASGDTLPPAAAKPGWIGIWEPRSENGASCFQRSRERASEWTSWADRERLEPKGEKKRVVLVGESVARGYFYDPRITPAQVLETLLHRAEVPGGVEVVDLAKNDLDGLSVGPLLASALALQPDLFVLFVGNNWAQAPNLVRGGIERGAAATVLREQGVAGYKAYLEEKLVGLFDERLAGNLAALSARVPVVILVPEFNLGDWRFDGPADAPWLPGDGNRRWLESFFAARQALAAGRLGEAEERARQMIDLDRGTASAGFTVLADCRRRQGDEAGSRELLERARDAHSWEITAQPPRPLTVVQQALRRTAGRGRVTVVDLPRVFEDWLGGLPDRRLFLDYCHLNADGIRLAMAAAAAAIAPLIGGRKVDHRELAALPIAPPPEVEAEARFAAAVHNAHWGQPFAIVHHHCARAIAVSRRVSEAMSQFLELQARRAPAWMCAAGEKLAMGALAGPLRRYFHVYMVYSQGKFLDVLLLEAISAALEEAGIAARERLASLRRQEQGVTAARPADLLSSYYRIAWTSRDWMRTGAFYHRAHSPVSEFSFVCAAAAPVTLQLVCRRPAGGDESCAVLVNGSQVASLALTGAWMTHRILVPAESLKAGVNALEIRWPLGTRPGEAGIENAARDLEAGLPYSLLPTFAEIDSLAVSVAAP
jgi:hypothetical protein